MTEGREEGCLVLGARLVATGWGAVLEGCSVVWAGLVATGWEAVKEGCLVVRAGVVAKAVGCLARRCCCQHC